MPLITQKEFPLDELNHPELINQDAYDILVCIRRQFGRGIIITDDARVAGEAPPGASKTSLHYRGRAFDIRTRTWNAKILWEFTNAVMTVADWIQNSDNRAPV